MPRPCSPPSPLRLYFPQPAVPPLTGYPIERRQRLERYLPLIRTETRDGVWSQSTPASLRLVLRYDELLWSRGVDGSVAEIGVLDGAFLIGLTQLLPDGLSSVLAIDCFDLAHYIPDPAGHGSGRASMQRFLSNVAAYAHRPETVVPIEADSIHVQARDVDLAAAVKLFSVDGLHTEDHAFHDLNLAADLLAPGGIIIVDDFPNHGCPGVKDAAIRFMTDSGFVPVGVAENKLFLARWDYAPAYCLNFACGVE